MSRQLIASLIWLLLALAGAAGLYSTIQGVQPPAPRPTTPSARLPGLPDSSLANQPVSSPQSGDAMTTRPLFARNRRPPEVVPTTREEVPTEAPLLVGTARQDGRMIALVRLPGQENTQRVAEGDRLGGWRVLSIAHGNMRVSDGRREQTLMAWQPSAAPAR